MSKIIKPGESEFYNQDWVEVTLKINPKTGSMHAVGGDRADGDPNSDRPYLGFEIIKEMVNQMNFNKYQQLAMQTRAYDDRYRVMYPALGLAGEVGELCNKVKKIFRDDEGELKQERLEQILGELGDCQWYLACLAYDLGVPLEVVALHNIQKLAKRQEEDKIHGEGDER